MMQSGVWTPFAIFLLTIIVSNPVTTVASNLTTLTSGPNNVKDLYIMGFYPYSGQWHGGDSMFTATTLGINQINSMQIIPGYRLTIKPSDTKCNPGYGIKGLFEELYNPPTKLMILGAACSAVSEAIAQSSHLWSLVQVSYASVSPALSNKQDFPLFARVAAPGIVPNPARMELLRYFGWTRVAVIYQTLELFSKTILDLTRRLEEEGFTLVRSEMFSDDPALQVRSLKENDCQIIIGSFYEDKARRVMCEAYKVGLYGRRIVWIVNGWYEAEWWKTPDDSIDCTPEQLGKVVEGCFDVGIVYLNPDPIPSVSGWLPSQFLAAFDAAIGNQSRYGDIMAPQGYDAVWAIALALNRTKHRLLEMGSPKRLEDFTYNDTELAHLLYSSLLNVTFMGVRGPIGFDAFGDPVGLVKIGRIQGGVKKMVALYNTMNGNQEVLQWSQENPVIWEGGVPPRGWTEVRKESMKVTLALYAVMCVFAALGILLAGAFLTFNIMLRKEKLVKMSSPTLNNVILLGCMMTYSSVFVQDIGAGHGVIGCEAKTVLLVLGISLAFGSLFAKTWRVYVIFTNTRQQKRVFKDIQLLGMVAVLVLINMTVLILWRVLDPRTVKVTHVEISMSEDAAGKVEIQHLEYSCVSQYSTYFMGTLYGIFGLVLLLGTFLAFETRKVHYPELNDSKHIGMCIYNVAIMGIPAIVLDMALDTGLDLGYGTGSALILLGTTVTQCFLFVPKVMTYRSKKIEPSNPEFTFARGKSSSDLSMTVTQKTISD